MFDFLVFLGLNLLLKLILGWEIRAKRGRDFFGVKVMQAIGEGAVLTKFSWQADDPGAVYLYKEGLFVRAYNEGAYGFIHHVMACKPMRRFVKSAGEDRVVCGVPLTVLAKLPGFGQSSQLDALTWRWPLVVPVERVPYEAWRESLPLIKPGVSAVVTAVSSPPGAGRSRRMPGSPSLRKAFFPVLSGRRGIQPEVGFLSHPPRTGPSSWPWSVAARYTPPPIRARTGRRAMQPEVGSRWSPPRTGASSWPWNLAAISTLSPDGNSKHDSRGGGLDQRSAI